MLISGIPVWAVLIDYVLGTVMWTLIGRSGMGLFLSEHSSFFFMKVFVRTTNPLLKIFSPVTPSFLIPLFIPLYVAWFFFMVRFYVMPYILGYDVLGMLSFPLEGEVAAFLRELM